MRLACWLVVVVWVVLVRVGLGCVRVHGGGWLGEGTVGCLV